MGYFMWFQLLFVSISFYISDGAKSDSYCITKTSTTSGDVSCLNGDIFLKGKYIEVGINNVGSYGTNSTAPNSYVYGGKQLGFIADFDQNGFDSGSRYTPGFAGDYFVPGIPIEGWILQWTTSADDTLTKVNEGLMGREDIKPSTFSITSTDSTQSSLWVGRSGDVQTSITTSFNNDDMFFTTQITIQNVGSDVISDLYYMRTVDPDPARVFYGRYDTLNYVNFQPAAADGSDSGLPAEYVNPLYPDAALVSATSDKNFAFYVGLGTIHPNARVSHFGFDEMCPCNAWSDGEGDGTWRRYGGNDVLNTVDYKSRMRKRDEAIHLVFKFDKLQSGEVVQFGFAYILDADDLVDAITRISIVTITQPTLEVSGSRVTYSFVSTQDFSSAEYYVFGVKPSVSILPDWYKVGELTVTDSGDAGANVPHTIFFNSFDFSDGDVVLKVLTYSSSGLLYSASKAARISNTGVAMDFAEDEDDSTCTFTFPQAPAVTLTLEKLVSTDPDPTSVRFFRETFSGGTVHSVAIGTDNVAPFQVTVSVADLSAGDAVVIKALITHGDDITQATICGEAVAVNYAPTDITLFPASGLTVAEGTAIGTILGAFETVDANVDDSHTYTLTNNGGGLFSIVNGELVVAGVLDHETMPTITIRVRTDDGNGLDCCFEKNMVIYVTNVNEPPSSPSLTLQVREDSPLNTAIHTIEVMDPDLNDAHSFSLVNPSSTFALSGTGTIYVKSALDHETKDTYFITVRVLDNGVPNLFVDVPYTIRVTNVNEAPTYIIIDYVATVGGPFSNVMENTPVNTVVGQLSAQDPDIGDSHSFSLVSSTGGVFGVRPNGEVYVLSPIDFESLGSLVALAVKVTDAGGLDYVQTIKVKIGDDPEVPVIPNSEIVCYVDEDRVHGETVKSETPGVPSYDCAIYASSVDGTDLVYFISSDSSETGNYNDAFYLHDCEGLLFVNNDLDYESFNKYTLVVGVVTEGGAISYVDVVIHVVDVNEQPSLTGSTYSVDEHSAVGTVVIPSLMSHLSDPDSPSSSSFTFTIVSGNSGGVFSFSDPSTGQLSVVTDGLNFEAISSYMLQIRVTDQGGLHSTASYTINVNDVNEYPCCLHAVGTFATIEENIDTGTRVGIGITAFDDDIGQILTVSLVGGNTDDAFSLTEVEESGSTYYYIVAEDGCCDASKIPVYHLSVKVTDNGYPPLSYTCVYSIAVSESENSNPISIQSPLNFSIVENSGQYTNVGDPLDNYVTSEFDVKWSITDYGGNVAHTFAINAVTGQLFLDLSFLSYELTPAFKYVVTARDADGNTAATTVNIRVVDVDEAPTMSSCPPALRYENDHTWGNLSMNGDPVIYEADDDDSTSLTWSIVSVNGDSSLSSMFTIVPFDSGSKSVYIQTSWGYDYEFINSYEFELGIMDGSGNCLYKTCTVSVGNVNDNPTMYSSQTCYVSGNADTGTVICDANAQDGDSPTDPNGWGTLTYTASSPIDGVTVVTTGTIGEIKLTNSVLGNGWSEGQTITGLVVRATDGGGLFVEMDVTIVVIDTNDPPTCPSNSYAPFQVDEGTLAGHYIGTLTGTDPVLTITDDMYPLVCEIADGNAGGQFVLSSDCVLSTGSVALDYETKAQHQILVKATEVTESPLSVWCAFFVDVINIPDEVDMSPQTFYVDENIPSGPLKAGSVPVGPVIVADPEGGGTFSLSCSSVSDCGDDPITIDASSGRLTLKSGYKLNYEAFNMYKYTATYTRDSETVSNTVTVVVNNINEAPSAVCSDFTVAESIGSVTVGYIEAYDPDFEHVIDFAAESCGSDCGLKYTLVSCNGPFELHESTGKLSVTSGGIDYSNGDVYNIAYMVKDQYGLSSVCSIRVYVTDVDDCEVTSITDINGHLVTAADTSGGLQLIVMGKSFGPTASTRAELGISDSDISVSAQLRSEASSELSTYTYDMHCTIYRSSSVDNSELRCSLPSGVGANLGLVVTINTATSSDVDTCITPFSVSRVSYGPPVLNSINPNPSDDSDLTLYFYGTNLGPAGSAMNLVSGTYSNSFFSNEIACIVVSSHTQVKCTPTHCYGSSLSWYLTVGGQQSNILSNVASCPSPEITEVFGGLYRELKTSGGEDFYIRGTNFGDEISNIVVTYGPSGEEYVASCTIIYLGTLLRCLSAPGTGEGHTVKIVVGDQSSSYPNAVSYLTPTISDIYGPGSHSGTPGREVVYISGTQYGPLFTSPSNIVVTYGPTGTEYTAADCRIIAAHVTVQCETVPGTGVNHLWVIEVDEQKSNAYSFTNYAPPVIHYYTGNGTESGTGGLQVVYITGVNFGATYDTVDAVYYEGYLGTVFDATSKCTMYTPHAVLRCLTLPGAGSKLVWTIIVDGQSTTTPSTSYAPPFISDLSGDGVYNASVYGGEYVNISGGNFGPPNAMELYGKEFLEYVTYGPSGTEYTAHGCKILSSELMQCLTAPGVGGGHVWKVKIAGQESPLSIVSSSYSAPQIFSIVPDTGNTDGTTLVSLFGSNLATHTSPVIKFGSQVLNASSAGFDMLKFFAPSISNVTRVQYLISVIVGNQQSNFKSFQYNSPLIRSVNAFAESDGSTTLNILGSSFSLKPVVRIQVDDRTILPSCSPLSHNEINCKISVKYGNVTVSTPVATSNARYFQYGEPVVLHSALTGGHAITSGYSPTNPAVLYIIGQNFGFTVTDFVVYIENRVTFNTASCDVISFTYTSKLSQPTAWEDLAQKVSGEDIASAFQEVTCKLPAGEGKDNSLKIARGDLESLGCGCDVCSSETCLSYLPPYIVSITSPCGTHECGSNICDDDGDDSILTDDDWWHDDDYIIEGDDILHDDDIVVTGDDDISGFDDDKSTKDDDKSSKDDDKSTKDDDKSSKDDDKSSKDDDKSMKDDDKLTKDDDKSMKDDDKSIKDDDKSTKDDDKSTKDDDKSTKDDDKSSKDDDKLTKDDDKSTKDDDKSSKDDDKSSKDDDKSTKDDDKLTKDDDKSSKDDDKSSKDDDKSTKDDDKLTKDDDKSMKDDDKSTKDDDKSMKDDDKSIKDDDKSTKDDDKLTKDDDKSTKDDDKSTKDDDKSMKDDDKSIKDDDKSTKDDDKSIKDDDKSTKDDDKSSKDDDKSIKDDDKSTKDDDKLTKDDDLSPTPSSGSPTHSPTKFPSGMTTPSPVFGPGEAPSPSPINMWTSSPSSGPTMHSVVTPAPTKSPTLAPTSHIAPTPILSSGPTTAPTRMPSKKPTTAPVSDPTPQPYSYPTPGPTPRPVYYRRALSSTEILNVPTSERRVLYYTPTFHPTRQPSGYPTISPTVYYPPTREPTTAPTRSPSPYPTRYPTAPPTVFCPPTPVPTDVPTRSPSPHPTRYPTATPTVYYPPTREPTAVPTGSPTPHPTRYPTVAPTVYYIPTSRPSEQPACSPTRTPTSAPSIKPSKLPTLFPSSTPTVLPTVAPTLHPTSKPTLYSFPTRPPTTLPTPSPSGVPTVQPTSRPSRRPTLYPTRPPTQLPTLKPTSPPTPTAMAPTPYPTKRPTHSPTRRPTRRPTAYPTPTPPDDDNVPPTGDDDSCVEIAACGSTEGGFSMVLRGQNFGSSRRVFVGETEWTVEDAKSNHTYVVVHGPPDEGSNLLVTMSVGNQNNTAPFNPNDPNVCYFSYFIPVIRKGISDLEIGTCDSQTVPIHGSNFGISEPIVRLGSNKLEVISFSQNLLLVTIPPGQGKDLVLSVTVGDQTGYSPDTFSFIAPYISSISTNGTVYSDGGRASNVTAVLKGSNFGYFNLSWSLTVGQFEVLPSDVVSWSCNRIEFFPPAGCGKNLRVKLAVGGQLASNDPIHFSYAPPLITGGVLPSIVSTDGTSVIVVYGKSFCVDSIRVFIYDRLYKTNDKDLSPTKYPTRAPTFAPTLRPTLQPTLSPTRMPTVPPTAIPRSPTPAPVATKKPTNAPTPRPTRRPTTHPTPSPTKKKDKWHKDDLNDDFFPTDDKNVEDDDWMSKKDDKSSKDDDKSSKGDSSSKDDDKSSKDDFSSKDDDKTSKDDASSKDDDKSSKDDDKSSKDDDKTSKEDSSSKDDDKSSKDDDSVSKEDSSSKDDDKSSKEDSSSKDDDKSSKDDDSVSKEDSSSKDDDKSSKEDSSSKDDDKSSKEDSSSKDDDKSSKEDSSFDTIRYSDFHSLPLENDLDMYESLDYFTESVEGATFFGARFPLREQNERRLDSGFYYMPPVEVPVLSHNSTALEFVMPAGAGSNLILLIAVGNQKTAVPFGYSPPIVERYYLSHGGSASGRELLRVYGKNFGAINSPLNVYIGDEACIDPQLKTDIEGVQFIECTTPATTVGDKVIRVEVAFHQVTSPIPYYVECKANTYGAEGEKCSLCGVGAVCDMDGMYAPKSASGFYVSEVPVPSDLCTPESQVNRDTCPAVMRCVPADSCTGNNGCAEGYKGERCGNCADDYYRINGKCQQCPDIPWALFFFTVLAVSVGFYIAYKLNQKNVSLGILAIGIDYMQVLGIFGTANVDWPEAIVNMYNAFSIFNFNIDVIAPGCWGHMEFTFRDKWITVSVLPLVVLVLCGILFGGYAIFMHYVKHSRKGSSIFYKFIGVYVMLFYYGYIMLANNTLAVFNCQPTDPSDGSKYMVEVGTNGGKCYEPGTLQQQLEPWAILCLIFYVIGFPLFVGYILFTNKEKVMYAQVIRASGSAEAELNEKPAMTKFKAMYTRLYYQFKPEFYFWVFMILMRKFALTVSAVIFRENIIFLLALYILILFGSYTLQVGHRPYMSTSEYPDVVVNYSYMLNEVSQDIIAKSDQKVKLKKRAARARLGTNAPLFQVLTPQLSFFNNYNTVESYLLFSGILICIAGIMFESGQLDSMQTDSLAVIVIMIVTISLLYFAWVLFGELWIAFFPDSPLPLLCIKVSEDNEVYKPHRQSGSVSQIKYQDQNPLMRTVEPRMQAVPTTDTYHSPHDVSITIDSEDQALKSEVDEDMSTDIFEQDDRMARKQQQAKRGGNILRMLSSVGPSVTPKIKRGFSQLEDDEEVHFERALSRNESVEKL